MNREILHIVGNVFAVVDLAWAAYESVRLSKGKSVLIQDAFEFFQEHPEHLPGIYAALAVAGVALLLILNFSRVGRFIYALTPGGRFQDMTDALQIEMHATQKAIDFRVDFLPQRRIERQTIALALREIGIEAPYIEEPHDIYAGFLAAILPYARMGDVKSARRAAASFIVSQQ